MIRIELQPKTESPTIPKEIYSHFAEHLGTCIYGGIWVGENSEIPNTRGIRNDVVQALRDIKIPVLRWPGGCFADEYHWKDGIGPRENRPSMYNTHWGGVVENNHFGTHEFFDLCEQLGCEAYVCGNVGSGTVQEMSEWVEYITSPASSPMANLRRKNGRNEPWRMAYFGVGNESWGCGGNMRPEYYADLYRRYNTFVRTYGPNQITRIACGANTADVRWTEVMMDRARGHMDGLSLHYYTLKGKKWPPSGFAFDFEEKDWYSILDSALHMDSIIQMHSDVMDKTDEAKRINLVVDEWGTWHASDPGTKPGFLQQQNALRDALVASLHFDIFHRHCERVRMTNIAQTINVLQAMILTDGPKMVKTPTYWAFHLYACHHSAQRVDLALHGVEEIGGEVKVPSISATASRKDGAWHVSATCLDPNKGRTLHVTGLPAGAKLVEAKVLIADRMQACNTFDQPDLVKPAELMVKQSGDLVEFETPPMSIVTIKFKEG